MATVIAGELEPAIQGVLAGAKLGALMQEFKLRRSENALAKQKLANDTSLMLLEWDKAAQTARHNAAQEEYWAAQTEVDRARAAVAREQAETEAGRLEAEKSRLALAQQKAGLTTMTELLSGALDPTVSAKDFTQVDAKQLVDALYESDMVKQAGVPDTPGSRQMWYNVADALHAQLWQANEIEKMRAWAYALGGVSRAGLDPAGRDAEFDLTAAILEEKAKPFQEVIGLLNLQKMKRARMTPEELKEQGITPEVIAQEEALLQEMLSQIDALENQAGEAARAARQRSAERVNQLGGGISVPSGFTAPSGPPTPPPTGAGAPWWEAPENAIPFGWPDPSSGMYYIGGDPETQEAWQVEDPLEGRR